MQLYDTPTPSGFASLICIQHSTGTKNAEYARESRCLHAVQLGSEDTSTQKKNTLLIQRTVSQSRLAAQCLFLLHSLKVLFEWV